MSITYRKLMCQKYIISSCLLVTIMLAGCTTRETVKEKEVTKKVVKEVPPPKKILNFDLREREFARNNNISVIDKLRFDYDKDDKLIPKGKVSSTSYDQNGFITRTI